MGVNQRTAQFVGAALAAQALIACSAASLAPGGQALSGIAPASVPGVRSSWIDPRAKGAALLYVSDSNASTVFVYSYPQLRPVGQLTGFYLPAGLCVNRRNGNVWVTDTFKNKVFEYAHGGTTPIREVYDSGAYVRACAVNPKTGDLAVLTDATDDPSRVIIFKPGHSTSTTYSDYEHAYSMFFDAYDPSGNLFADGTHYVVGHVTLEELAKGAGKLTNIPWNGPAIRYPSGAQYDGTYFAIGDERKHLIYQTNNGTVVSTTTLKGACLLQQFFVYEGLVVASSWCGSSGDVLIYRYPAGGHPVRSLSGFKEPFGVVMSR